MRIDCGDCAMRETATCDDCIVTFLLDGRDGAIVFDVEEERALRALAEGGLTRTSRFVQAKNRA